MASEIDYYFDVASPAAYLSWTQMPQLAQDTGAKINYRPILLGGLFKATGNSSPITVPAKGKWLFADLHRWANRYDVPFVMNDRFPINSLYLMRGLIAYQCEECFLSMADAFFDGMWVSNKDMGNPDVVAAVLKNIGVEPENFMQRINDAATKQKLMDATKEIEKRGGFGVPTFFVGDDMFWGQDRLDFVHDALAG